MITLTLQEIADITGGVLDGPADLRVAGPASVDSRHMATRGLFAAIAGEHVDGHDFVDAAMHAGAAAVLATRAVEAPAVIVDDTQQALTDLARETASRLTRDQRCTVIAVTGSQGKTSVKDLIAQLLSALGNTVAARGSFNNELGVPLTILAADDHTRFLVLEMGARGIGHIDYLCGIAQPDISVVLNVGSAHLGEFGSVEAIAAAKGEIVEALDEAGTAILNADDSAVAAMGSRTAAKVVTFGSAGDVRLSDVNLDSGGHANFTLGYRGATSPVRLELLGAHQGLNAAAAAAVALSAGMNLDAVADALEAARPASPMRMEIATNADGVIIINDAYNANPDSMAAALHTLGSFGAEHRTCAVLGEMLELGELSVSAHRDLGILAATIGIDHVVIVGEPAAGIAAGIAAAGTATTVDRAVDVTEATQLLGQRLGTGDVVLIKASRAAGLERVAAALLC